MKRLWHKDVDGPVFTFQTEWPIYSVQFVPQEVNLLLTSSEGGIHLWDVRSHKSYLERIGGSTTGGKSTLCIHM